MVSISEEFSGGCFDYDHLSASSLGGLVLKRGQKEAVSHSRKIYHVMDPFQHRDEFSKEFLGLVISSPFRDLK